MNARGLLLAAVAMVAGAPSSLAQDFAAPWEATGSPAAALLEHGLAPAGAGASLEFLGTRWLGVPGLETRAVAFGAGWRSARLAAGASSTGDAELGWTAVALAAGAARAGSGAAVRLIARRSRASRADGRPDDGAEAGAGARLRAAPGLERWASAPQLWADGAAPPLVRGLTLGVRVTGGDAALWIARESARLGAGEAMNASHAAGVWWSAGGLTVAFEGRDLPLRGAIAIAAVAGPLEVAARVESHPLAGETTRLAVRWFVP